jgi:dolichol-phosphate mannosyltransferase
MSSDKVTIVIPLYNEGTHILNSFSKIKEVLEKANIPHDFVLVDDGSTDNTWETLNQIRKDNPSVTAIQFSHNFGKENAICAGLSHVTEGAAIIVDGDLQHPPSLLPKIYERWQSTGAPIVEAVKSTRGRESFFSKLSAKLYYGFIKIFTSIDLSCASDYKLLNRQAIDTFLQLKEYHVFYRAMIAWIGFKSEQIPFEVSERTGGTSKFSLKKLISLAIDGITSFSAAPLKVITIIGLIFFAFAMILGFYSLYLKLSDLAVSGFTTVIILQLVIGSIIMFSLGIIGIYLAKIFEEVKKRPRYIINKKLTKGDV